MKKHLALVAGIAVLSSSAYATKARLMALGQPVDGSYYVSDTRSVFLNPAHVNTMNKYLVAEWGDSQQGAYLPGVTNPGDHTMPTAEGGYFGAWKNFAYGIYLNKQDAESNGACRAANNFLGAGGAATAIAYGTPILGCVGRNNAVTAAGVQANTTAGFMTQQDTVDLFFGGDHGLKWGFNFYWAESVDSNNTQYIAGNYSNRSSETSGIRAGVAWNNLEVFTSVQLEDFAQNGVAGGTDVYDLETNYSAGISYNWRNYTFLLAHEERRASELVQSAKSNSGRYATNLKVGYQKSLGGKAKMFTDVGYRKFHAKYSRAGAAAGAANTVERQESNGWEIPLNLAFETEVFTWLTARGAVSQGLAKLDHREIKIVNSTTSTDNRWRGFGHTSVQFGATLEFGKLKIDGLVGNTLNGGRPTNGSKAGLLNLDNLLSQVGASYWF